MLIALITAKTWVSPIRTLTYEALQMGWPLTIAGSLGSSITGSNRKVGIQSVHQEVNGKANQEVMAL